MTDRMKGLMSFIMKGVKQEDFDCVIIIDGPEGVGKSTMGMHCKMFCDGKYNLDHVCYDSTDLLEHMRKAPKYSTIILDEAITSFMSRTALDRWQVRLVQAFSIVREKNLVFFLIIPNIGLLDKALLARARYRIWVYSMGHVRGHSKIFYARRTEWTTGKPWYEESWHYEFPDLPEKTKREYKAFKSKELDRKLGEYEDERKFENERKANEKQKARGVKTQMIIDYLEKNKKATDIEIARAVKCSLQWARDTAAVYR